MRRQQFDCLTSHTEILFITEATVGHRVTKGERNMSLNDHNNNNNDLKQNSLTKAL